jgi:hypothetical protein
MFAGERLRRAVEQGIWESGRDGRHRDRCCRRPRPHAAHFSTADWNGASVELTDQAADEFSCVRRLALPDRSSQLEKFISSVWAVRRGVRSVS